MFFAPGCPGKIPCEQPFLCPRSLSTLSIPSTPRTRAAKRSRQSRWDGRTRQGLAGENGRKRTETVQNGGCAGVPGEWHSVDFRFPPLNPVPFRFSRQSRRDGRTRQGLAGELGTLGVLGLLGALSVFCAGVPGENPLRTALSLPALSQYS